MAARAESGTRVRRALSPATAQLPLTEWQAGTSAATLAAMLFSGRFVVIRQLPVVDRIVARARDIVETTFGSRHPQCAERELPPEMFTERAVGARRAVEADARLGRYWRETLVRLGYGDDDCYADRLCLRVVPSARMASKPSFSALPPHRDNWASGVAAQINWWLPLYPLAATRTMLVWPDLFDRAVPNDSDSWNPAGALSSAGGSSRLLPSATAVPECDGQPVLIEPGSLLAFSGAQLHSSARDDSGISRLSLDTRTVSADDVRCDRGATDIDGAARRPHYEWFRHPKDPDGELLATLAEGNPPGLQ